MSPLFRRLPLALTLVLALAACESREERAARFYQSALTFLQEGEEERALIQLRNVFDNDGFHREARQLYAGLLLARGNKQEAYGQYLRLVEQYPKELEARENLALMALEQRNWDEALRHGETAIEIDPDRPGTRAIAAALKYRTALMARNPNGAADAVAEARAVIADAPEVIAAHRLVIDSLLSASDAEGAMTAIDAALAQDPDSYEFNMLKGRVLSETGQIEALGAQLVRLYALFPQDEEVRAGLIRWYLANRDFAGAEAFLRGEAGPPDTDIDGNMAVYELLRRAEQPEAASAELDRLIEVSRGSDAERLYRTFRAATGFESGDREAAIAEVEATLEGAEPSEISRRIRIILARMLGSMDNRIAARAQIEQVLAEDSNNTEALKLRAAAQIRVDQVGPAIVDLRLALDQDPFDAQTLALMAEAFLRNGNPQLARERLAQAVQVSQNTPEHAIRYARFLMQSRADRQAETVLVAALRRAPENFELLGLLGEVYLREQNWPQAQRITNRIRDLATDEARQLARVYQSSILLGQNRIEEGLEYLRAQAEAEEGESSAAIHLVRTLILTGRLGEARIYVDERLEDLPDSIPLQLVSANLHALEGQLDEAEGIYRDLLSRRPDIEPAVLQLQALLRATDRSEEADDLVQRSLEVLPGSRRLRLLEAVRLERRGKFEEAIVIYEELYDQDSSDIVIANNLASMLTNHRDSEEDFERAFRVSRKLLGTQVPAFRDTLGWVFFLRGDIPAAITELEAAAEALPQEPAVAIHLGLTYAEAGEVEKARIELERGLLLAEERTDVPFTDRAAQVLAGLPEAGSAPATPGQGVTEP